MSAPLLWMGIPLLASLTLAVLYRYARAVSLAGSLLSALLAYFAWKLPIDEATVLGPWKIELVSRMDIFGRSLTLDNSDRLLVAFFYAAAFIWFAGSRAAEVHRLFVPIGLAIVVLLIAVLAVEPFLYAALFIEIAVLISIPLLYPPGSRPGQGVLRYLIFQTMAMPFILFTGWILTGLEAGSADLAASVRAGVMLGLGFAFLLAVFPFYTWIPLVSQQVDPYAGGFILFILPTASLLFGLTFFEQFAWVRTAASLPAMLSLMGALMITTGGLWSMFQNHLGRIFGYAVIVETGFSLLAAWLGRQEEFSSFALLLVPRLVAMAVWALALTLIYKRTGTLNLTKLAGIGRAGTLTPACLLVAQASMAGLPLLAAFPVKFNLLAQVATSSPATAGWILLGIFGSIIACLRTAYTVFLPIQNGQELKTTRWQKTLLTVGVAALLLIGLIPQWILPPFHQILQAFQNIIGA